MAQSERKFMVRMIDGQEYGPVDQEGLVRWAQKGRLTSGCQVRNALMTRWNRPEDLPFLKEIIEAQEAAKAPEPTLLEKMKQQATMKAKAPPKLKALHASGTFAFTPAGLDLRLGAALIDLAVVGLIWVVLLVALSRMLGPASASYPWLVLAYLSAVMYLAWTIGFRAQTLGMQFWGVLVVQKDDGAEVLLGRAFIFAAATVFLGVLSPLLVKVLPSSRGVGDIFSGTRVVRTRVIHR